MSILNYGVYLRVSTNDKQDITTQELFMDNYMRQNNLCVYKVYKDVGESGAKESRPQFDLMLEDMRSKKINGIACYRLDRIGRNLQHLLSLFEEFKKKNIHFISATQNINTTSPEGMLFIHILMILANYERELIKSRVHDGLNRAKEQGKKLGRPKGKHDTKTRRKSGYYLKWNIKKRIDSI